MSLDADAPMIRRATEFRGCVCSDKRRILRATWPGNSPLRLGYTLTELIVVLGLIALLMAAAVPLFSYLSGNRDIDAAQNIVSSYLARAHEEAMTQQDGRGVIFYEEPQTGRIAMSMVYYDDPYGQPTQLDLFPGEEPVVLPRGVGAAFVQPDSSASSRYTYLGVVIFDGRGQASMMPCNIRAAGTLGQVLGTGWDGTSQPGLMLFDRRSMEGQTDRDQYLDDNGLMLMVNRYHGTLSRAE